MAGIGLCSYDKCDKRETCFRYKNERQGDTYIDFQYICNEQLSEKYKWYWKKELELTKVEENKS